MGLGCNDALRTAVSEMNSGRMFVVDVDIKSYFDEIDHDILMDLIKAKISDGRILNLIEMFLKQGVMEGIEELDPEKKRFTSRGCDQPTFGEYLP